MRVPLEWLSTYCDAGIGARDLGDRLTMTGTKLEAVHHHGVRALDAFVVGKVLSAERHPDADRLSVCQVDVGTGEASGIVCGAPNVAAGQTVAVARPGAVMPDGTRLKRAKLRGVESDGMILAEDELDLGTAHDGIPRPRDGTDPTRPAPGTPLGEVLPLETDVLECEITPNRPDCLGVYGIAREVPRRHRRRRSRRRPGPTTRGRRGRRRRDPSRRDDEVPAVHRGRCSPTCGRARRRRGSRRA
jgi:phenylalanyl-tRNA synthetase beta chain